MSVLIEKSDSLALSGQDGQYMFIFHKDARLVAGLTQFAKELKIKGGQINAIGALKNVELGYYDLHKKEYIRKTFSPDDYELISLSGNITLKDGEPYVHVHAVLGDRNFQCFGGHLFDADVAVTVEAFVRPLGKIPRRKMDGEVGLALICGFAT